MIFNETVDVPPLDGVLLLPHAASTTTAAIAVNNRLRKPIRLASFKSYLGYDRRPPPDQTVLERCDQRLRHQRRGGEQSHAGEHTGRVEQVFREIDQLPDSLGRAEELTNDRADQSETEARVQAGGDPRQRGRDDDLGRQP